MASKKKDSIVIHKRTCRNVGSLFFVKTIWSFQIVDRFSVIYQNSYIIEIKQFSLNSAVLGTEKAIFKTGEEMIRLIVRIIFFIDLIKSILCGISVTRNDDCEHRFLLRLGAEIIIDIIAIVLTFIL